MNSNKSKPKKEAVENQEEALSHLIKAVDSISDSKQQLEEEKTQEVRLQVEESKNAKELEFIEQRIEMLEEIIKSVASNHGEMLDVIESIDKKHDTIADSLEELKQEIDNLSTPTVPDVVAEEKENDKIDCNICGRETGSKGFLQHVKFTHNIDVDELFKEGENYEADGYKASTFKELTSTLRNIDKATPITKLLNERIEYHIEKDGEEKPRIKCSICGKKYVRKQGFATHLRHRHDITGEGITEEYGESLIEEGESDEQDSEDEEDFRLACDECGKAFNKRMSLAGHLREVHDITGKKVTYRYGEEVDEDYVEPDDVQDTAEEDSSYNPDDLDCPFCDKRMAKTALSRHIRANHEKETQMQDFFYDEQKGKYCYRAEGREYANFSSLTQNFGSDKTATDVYRDAVVKGINSEQELYEKELKDETEEDTEEHEISDYERAKRDASVSDRDMQIVEQAFHKIIYDYLRDIPDHKEKFISYTGNANIAGFETVYEGDLSPLNMWRKLFSNTGLIKGIEDRIGDNYSLSWERKGTSGTPQNWVVKVERTDK